MEKSECSICLSITPISYHRSTPKTLHTRSDIATVGNIYEKLLNLPPNIAVQPDAAGAFLTWAQVPRKPQAPITDPWSLPLLQRRSGRPATHFVLSGGASQFAGASSQLTLVPSPRPPAAHLTVSVGWHERLVLGRPGPHQPCVGWHERLVLDGPHQQCVWYNLELRAIERITREHVAQLRDEWNRFHTSI